MIDDGGGQGGGLRIVEPAQDDEAAVPAAGVQPVAVTEIVGGDGNSHRAVGAGAQRTVGDTAVPALRIGTLVPDALQRDVPVAGVGRGEFEYQRLLRLERKVPIM